MRSVRGATTLLEVVDADVAQIPPDATPDWAALFGGALSAGANPAVGVPSAAAPNVRDGQHRYRQVNLVYGIPGTIQPAH